MARSDETRAAWLTALAEMEAVAGRSGDADWTPTPVSRQDLGPLPDDLIGRALEVQTAQKSALARVMEARRRVVNHITALKSVPESRDTGASVYLDASA